MPDRKVIPSFQTSLRRVRLLDKMADERDISRSELIREALDEKLDREFFGIEEPEEDDRAA